MNAKARQEKSLGPYRCVERIGEGGQGTVWRAFKGEGSEAVAVKELRLSRPKKRARFIQEITIHKALSAAKAPNVMPLLDDNLEEIANGGMQGYLVMPVAEVALDDVIDTVRDRLELSMEILSGIATGLAAAHAAGVIHRDLKPGNVLFLNRSLREPLISDFGICLLRETAGAARITEVGETVGAKYFMAPEQEHGGVSDVTFAADVYAAGKLLHFMLTGRYLLREHLEKAFRPDEMAREPRLQAVLEELLARCLVEDPAGRLQDGAELLTVCERLLTTFRSGSVPATRNGGSLRKAYDLFLDAFAVNHGQASVRFDEAQDQLRSGWLDLHGRVEADDEHAAAAAEEFMHSQPSALAASLALARMDHVPMFAQFKRLLEFTTGLGENVTGYKAVIAIPQVEAGFLYMAATLLALHNESWGVLEKLLTVKFEMVYQSSRLQPVYGFDHPGFFHSDALKQSAPAHHDLFRTVLLKTDVREITRLEKESLFDVYAQADLLLTLRAVQVEQTGQHVGKWPDFGRFYGARVTPLLQRIQQDDEYAAGVLRAFGESREEFFDRLNRRIQYLRENWFGGSKFQWSSIGAWHPE